MPTVSFTRLATVADDGSYQREYLAKDPNTGIVSVRTEILEDTIVKSISNTVITNISTSLTMKVENISTQVTSNGKLNYLTTNKYIDNSLNVYYNGLQVAADISETGDKAFSFNGDYSSIINPNDVLIVSYIMDEVTWVFLRSIVFIFWVSYKKLSKKKV